MTQAAKSFDILLVGGGVMGLSLAWELAQRDAKVCVIDAGEMGTEASWAAAGMLPPGPKSELWEKCSAYERLQGLSQQLHPEWHARLAEQTEINNGYRLTGAIYLAGSPNFVAHLAEWQRFDVPYQDLDRAAITDLEPALTPPSRAALVPDEAQVRPPRHLKALVAACQRSGVTLKPGCQLLGWQTESDRITGAITSMGRISAGNHCLTRGCWTGVVSAGLGLDIAMQPVRGQILLLRGPVGTLQRIINSGPRYITSRPDGRVLVGSTQEDVGFDKRNTAAGLAELTNFACETCPALANFTVEKCWSGLRPRTADDLPYLGRLPRFENGWIAAGHFRAGIQLSPATAVVMRALMLGETPPVDVSEMGLDRCDQ
jgi:glycine oxidase